MSDWADDEVDRICELDIEALSHEDWRIKFQAAVTAALRKARADAMEEAAKVAYGFTGAQHAAHDMKAGIFPIQSHMGEAIATAIRNLKEKT